MFQATCTNEEKVRAHVSYVTSTGAPAVVDGATHVEVQSGDGTFERLGPHEFYLVSGFVPDDTLYVISADVDLGEGVETLTDAITLTVTNARAAAFGVSFGLPERK